jgi:hypothetical protein
MLIDSLEMTAGTKQARTFVRHDTQTNRALRMFCRAGNLGPVQSETRGSLPGGAGRSILMRSFP